MPSQTADDSRQLRARIWQLPLAERTADRTEFSPISTETPV